MPRKYFLSAIAIIALIFVTMAGYAFAATHTFTIEEIGSFNLAIMSYSPISLTPVQDKGTSNTFTVTVNQPVTNKWFLDTVQQSSTAQSFTKTWSSSDIGLRNITYVGDNINGSAAVSWSVTVVDPSDVTPPIISSISSAPGIYSATVTWETDEPANSTVDYVASIATDSEHVLSHSVALTGLATSTTYYYNISSCDAAENCASSSQYSFTTLDESETSSESLSASEGSGSSGGSGGAPTVKYTTAAKITEYPKEIKIYPNGSIDFDITLMNTGDSALSGLSVESTNPWLSFDTSAFGLAINEEKTVPIKLLVPQSAQIGIYLVNISIKGYDTISFSVIVTNSTGSASVAMMDVEIVRKSIELLKQRINIYSDQGYNITAPKEFVEKAEELFGNGQYLEASDYASIASDLLEKTIVKNIETKTFLISYVLAGVIVCLLVLLYYYYGRYQKENVGAIKLSKNELNKKITEKNEENEPKSRQPNDMLEQDVNIDDMLKRLEEIRKKVGK